MRTNSTLLLLFVVLSFGLASCATTTKSVDGMEIPASVPSADVMPVGGTFGGAWYSQEFLHMYMVQNGSSVSGIYTFKNGGVISGTVQGNLLIFTWEEPGDREEARRTLRGHGYLALTLKDGKMVLNGRWGYDDSYDDGGPWTATFMRESSPDDPKSLQEWKDDGMEP